MLLDVMSSTSVVRLQGILQSRYGKGLELSFINDSSALMGEEGSFSIRNGTLLIPIFSHGHFLAMAKIPAADTLSTSAAEAIVAVVKLILEPALYNWYLKKSESELSNQEGFQQGLHVIDLNDSDAAESEKAPIALLISRNPNRIHKVAMQVHEQWKRWAFLSWNEIRSQIATIQDLRDLGQMTILVEEVLTLSEDEKFLLNEWLKISKAEHEPALILGTTQSWSELKEESILPEFMLSQAGFSQIEVEKLPADRKFCEEAIKLLLDKSTGLQ